MRVDGREVLLSVNGKAVFDDSGKFKGYRGTGTDITERKHAEDALRESEALLAQAAQMANLGHWVWDEIEDRCVYCSEPLAQISGVSVEEYLQRYATVEDLLVEVHPEDRARYERVLAEAKRELAGLGLAVRQ